MTAMRWRQEAECFSRDGTVADHSRVPASRRIRDESAHYSHKELSMGTRITSFHPTGRVQQSCTHVMPTRHSVRDNHNKQTGQSYKVPDPPRFDPQHQQKDLEHHGGIRLCAPASGDVLSIESLESDDLPACSAQGVAQSLPSSHGSATKRSKSLTDSISLAPVTQIAVSPDGFSLGAEGHSRQKAPCQTGASLKDVLEASKHRTTVRMEAANLSAGDLVHGTPHAVPLSTATAAASLLRWFNTFGKSTTLADAVPGTYV